MKSIQVETLCGGRPHTVNVGGGPDLSWRQSSIHRTDDDDYSLASEVRCVPVGMWATRDSSALSKRCSGTGY